MGNQQDMKYPFELGWLVGALESEGTIGIHKANKSGSYYKPIVKIFNTDMVFINRVCEYCALFEIGHYIHKSSSIQREKKYKPVYSVTIGGYLRLLKFLNLVQPYVRSKEKHVEVILQIINSRLAAPMTKGNRGREFSQKEMLLIDAMKELNRRGKDIQILRDYTPNSESGDDIVRPPAKSGEATEMIARLG